MVELLGADFPELTARQLDAGQLDFPAGSFDLVTAGFLVQVLDDPAAAIAEIRRVLAPGGVVALSLERQLVGQLRWLQQLSVEFFTRQTEPEAAQPETEPEAAGPEAAGPEAAGPEAAQPAASQPSATPPRGDTPPADNIRAASVRAGGVRADGVRAGGGETAARGGGPLTDRELTGLLSAAGFGGLASRPVEMPLTLADPAALWEWLMPRGLADAVQRMPAGRNAEFRRRFLAGAEHMRSHGGIVLDFRATLHRAQAPG
jgi:hypothetical protein